MHLYALYILKQGFGSLLSFKLETGYSLKLPWANLCDGWICMGKKKLTRFHWVLLQIPQAVGFLPCVKGCRATGTQRRTPFNLGKSQVEKSTVKRTSSQFPKPMHCHTLSSKRTAWNESMMAVTSKWHVLIQNHTILDPSTHIKSYQNKSNLFKLQRCVNYINKYIKNQAYQQPKTKERLEAPQEQNHPDNGPGWAGGCPDLTFTTAPTTSQDVAQVPGFQAVSLGGALMEMLTTTTCDNLS